RRGARRLFRDLGQHVAALGESPSPAQARSCVEAGRDAGAEELTVPLQALLEGYLEALAQVVEAQEEAEALKAKLLVPGAGDRGPAPPRYPTFPFERSRQQMVGRLTPNFRWQTATPLLQQVLGRPIERLNGRPFLRVVHPDDRDRVERALGETLKDGESHN